MERKWTDPIDAYIRPAAFQVIGEVIIGESSRNTFFSVFLNISCARKVTFERNSAPWYLQTILV